MSWFFTMSDRRWWPCEGYLDAANAENGTLGKRLSSNLVEPTASANPSAWNDISAPRRAYFRARHRIVSRASTHPQKIDLQGQTADKCANSDASWLTTAFHVLRGKP
jgi:hypothetical protein